MARLSFRHSEQWRTDPFADVRVPEIDRRLKGAEMVNGRLVVHSLSGHERNHLFLNRHGQSFDDRSLISGLDNPADSRSFATLDYDHDGRLDIALVNANYPLLNLYRNQISPPADSGGTNQFIAIRFVGANHVASPANQTARDGYGAIAEIHAGNARIKREHRCGEGYGAQNSATMIIGLGAALKADQLQIRWPSGVECQLADVAAGSFVTAFEDASQANSGTHFEVQPYAKPIKIADRPTPRAKLGQPTLDLATARSLPASHDSAAQLKLYVTTATWCTACIEHLPHLRHLVSTFDEQQIELIGVPIDPEDDVEKLINYRDTVSPPYRLILEMTASQRDQIRVALAEIQPPDAIPATVVTDAAGHVRFATAGAPTVSQIRKLLAELNEPQQE